MVYDPILCMNVPDKANDAKSIDSVKEYEFHYKVPGDSRVMVGSGRGSTEEEAKADFMKIHKSENPIIVMSKLYKTIDKAIRNMDANKADGFRIHNAVVRNDTLYITFEDLLNSPGKKETMGFTKTEAKQFTKDPWNTWLGTTKMVVEKFIGGKIRDGNSIYSKIKEDAQKAVGGKYGFITNLSDLETAIKDATRRGEKEDAKKLKKILKKYSDWY